MKIQGEKSKKRKQVLQTPNEEREDSYVSERSKTAIQRERKTERQSMYSRSPGPAAGVLLTCAQPFPASCPHKEAVMGVCVGIEKRKQKAERHERE